MSKQANHFVTGIDCFLSGFGLITKPGLKRFVIIPFVINMLIFLGLFFLFRHFVAEFNLWFANFLPRWLHWLSAVLWILFFISFFLCFIYTFVLVANIISAPFNGLLAEQVERYLTGKLSETRSIYDNVKDIPRIIGRQLALLGYYLPRALLILILFFIPVIQAVAALLWFLFNAWMLTLQYVDYPTDNHRVPLRDVHQYLKQHYWATLGFGMITLVATMVPVLNFFVMPAAVAGATKMWLAKNP